MPLEHLSGSRAGAGDWAGSATLVSPLGAAGIGAAGIGVPTSSPCVPFCDARSAWGDIFSAGGDLEKHGERVSDQNKLSDITTYTKN